MLDIYHRENPIYEKISSVFKYGTEKVPYLFPRVYDSACDTRKCYLFIYQYNKYYFYFIGRVASGNKVVLIKAYKDMFLMCPTHHMENIEIEDINNVFLIDEISSNIISRPNYMFQSIFQHLLDNNTCIHLQDLNDETNRYCLFVDDSKNLYIQLRNFEDLPETSYIIKTIHESSFQLSKIIYSQVIHILKGKHLYYANNI